MAALEKPYPYKTSVPPGVNAVESLRKEGYILLRYVLGTATLESIRQLVDTTVLENGPEVQQRAGTIWIKDANILGPQLTRLYKIPIIFDIITDFLGAAEPRGAVMRNPIGPTAQQALHVDWAEPIKPGQDQLVQAMFFLDDVTLENGPTRIVPKSHNFGQIPDKKVAANPQTKHKEEIYIEAEAGDVLIFSAHVWHGGTANNSGMPRRVITANYIKVTS